MAKAFSIVNGKRLSSTSGGVYPYVEPDKNRNDYLVVPLELTPKGRPIGSDSLRDQVEDVYFDSNVMRDNYGNIFTGHHLITFDHHDGGRIYHLTDDQRNLLGSLLKKHLGAALKKSWRASENNYTIPMVNHDQSPLETMVKTLECSECTPDHKPTPYLPLQPNTGNKYRY